MRRPLDCCQRARYPAPGLSDAVLLGKPVLGLPHVAGNFVGERVHDMLPVKANSKYLKALRKNP